jgi:hypothetical protein
MQQGRNSSGGQGVPDRAAEEQATTRGRKRVRKAFQGGNSLKVHCLRFLSGPFYIVTGHKRGHCRAFVVKCRRDMSGMSVDTCRDCRDPVGACRAPVGLSCRAIEPGLNAKIVRGPGCEYQLDTAYRPQQVLVILSWARRRGPTRLCS